MNDYRLPPAILEKLSAKSSIENSVILQDAYAGRRSLLERGNSKPAVLDLSGFAAVIEHRKEDQVISVQTGIKLPDLNKMLSAHNQWLPIAGYHSSTLLNIINTGDGGYLEHGYGGPRHLILGLSVALAGGEIIKMGGKVVKNVTGYDTTKLFVGSRGTLGLPFEAHLRLYALPKKFVAVTVYSNSVLRLLDLADHLMLSGIPIAGLDLFVDKTDTVSGKANSDYLLVVNICNHENVVDEIVSRLDPLIEKYAHNKKIEDAAQQKLMNDLYSPFQQGQENFIDACMSRRLIRQFFAEVGDRVHDLNLHFRPGLGRLKLLPASDKHKDQLFQFLQTLADRVEPYTVAYADEQYEYRVDKLPENDAAIIEIKSNLKKKFDPHNRLNPFVSL